MRIHRAIAVLLLAGGLVLSAEAGASAEVAPRVASAEASAAAPYGFDQVSTHCPDSSAARDTVLAYEGEASLEVHTANDPECGGPYARGIFQANGPEHLVAGDDFWFGAAIYLPIGFYAAHTSYTDLLRVDSYVNDESESTPFANRAEINFASWNDDNLYVRAARGSTDMSLIGPIPPSQLPEGTWNWVEIHVRLDSASGSAFTELKIDGRSLGSSTRPNLFAGAEPLNRLRYGIVSTGAAGSGNLTAYFDRASISGFERGPRASAAKSPPPLDTAIGVGAARGRDSDTGSVAFASALSLPGPFLRVAYRRVAPAPVGRRRRATRPGRRGVSGLSAAARVPPGARPPARSASSRSSRRSP